MSEEWKPRWFLEELQDHPISKAIRVIYDLGANVYEEKEVFDRIYSHAESIVLFEPMPEQVNGPLKQEADKDPRITVIGKAVSDFDGKSQFHILGPVECNFASLTNLTDVGRRTSPTIDHRGIIEVDVCRLGTAIREHGLRYPDLLHMDVHGTEYPIFVDLIQNDFEILSNVKMIYCEVVSVEFYEGQHTIDEVKHVLDPYFEFRGWNPDGGVYPIGNAFWTKRGLV